ncbi:hypothetical protein SBDP1_320037 [Syntrophobacter sp. SbD1]|nr:hypothetical protein SBDP1_320037 [Syntrophobacter sp. SbD1]
MTREINIDRLHLRLPSAQSSPGGDKGVSLAKSVAEGLAKSFRRGDLTQVGGSLDVVHICVPTEQANAEGIVRAIQAAISKTAR